MKTKRRIKREAVRLFRFCFINGILDEARTREVVKRIIAAKRRDGLALLSQFHHLVRLNSDQHTAEVESAVPLTEVLRTQILSRLKRDYGSEVKVSFTHNPKLIGGLRIKVGSDLYDSSILAKLAELEKSF